MVSRRNHERVSVMFHSSLVDCFQILLKLCRVIASTGKDKREQSRLSIKLEEANLCAEKDVSDFHKNGLSKVSKPFCPKQSLLSHIQAPVTFSRNAILMFLIHFQLIQHNNVLQALFDVRETYCVFL